MATRVSKNELLWREWVLGEARYKDKGPRSDPRPNVGYGGPGQRKVPGAWWERLEAFLVRRNDKSETPGAPQPKPGPKPTPAKDKRLSHFFTVREFDCHDGRKVPLIAVPALAQLCQTYLDPLRLRFGPTKVMSGYRPRDYNAKIGGARFSQHIYELTPSSVASDLICASGRPRDWYDFLDDRGIGGLGLYDSFIHADNRPVRARWTG